MSVTSGISFQLFLVPVYDCSTVVIMITGVDYSGNALRVTVTLNHATVTVAVTVTVTMKVVSVLLLRILLILDQNIIMSISDALCHSETFKPVACGLLLLLVTIWLCILQKAIHVLVGIN